MLSHKSVNSLVETWYKKLDVHAPMVEVLPLLAEEGLEMIFPEATVYGHAGFEGWFQRVIRIFFDEVHTVKSVESIISEDIAIVKVVVKWEASVWGGPEPYSKRIRLDAFQTWEVRSNEKGEPIISKYKVDELKYYDGAHRL
jgi:hypothetical protein